MKPKRIKRGEPIKCPECGYDGLEAKDVECDVSIDGGVFTVSFKSLNLWCRCDNCDAVVEASVVLVCPTFDVKEIKNAEAKN